MTRLSVLIPDGENDLSFKAITCLSEKISRLEVHVISTIRNPRARYSRFCSSFHLRRDEDEEKWLELISKVAKENRVDVILPVFEYGTRFACKWREQLSSVAALPPLPPTSTFDLAANKGSLAQFLREHDLPHPRTTPLTEVKQGLNGFRFPVLVKPTRSNDGVGIRLFEDKASVDEFAGSHSREAESYIVQEFAEGADLSCSVFCRDGSVLAHTVHMPLLPHSRPFAASLCIRHVHHAHAVRTVKKLMSLLNWNGVANVDFKENEHTRRPEILEVNPRFSGNLVGSMTAGVNFPYLACLAALNSELPHSRYRLQCYMEVRDAAKAIAGYLVGRGGVFPHLLRETNLPFILRDPLPFLNRTIKRH
jgi:D-aspartate ligase